MEIHGIPKSTELKVSKILWISERLVEGYYPCFFGFLLSCAIFSILINRTFNTTLDVEKVLESVSTLASIFVGFVSTLLGILFSIKESRTVRNLMKIDVYKHLKSYMLQSIISNLLLAVFSLFLMIIGYKLDPASKLNVLCFSIWFFNCIVAILTVFRIGHIMHKLL